MLQSETKFGVLQLDQGKTYGRQTRPNGKPGKLYFGIKPASPTDKPVKVAYEPSKSLGGKNGTCNIHKNRFVSYQITECKTNERNIATLVDNFGPVDSLEAFVKYKFMLKGLHLNPSFGKELYASAPMIAREACERVSTDDDAIDIITIDPEGCKDIDDGIGIQENSDGSYTIAICITHLPSYLLSEKIGVEELQIGLPNPCSVYLPERVVHMFNERFGLTLFSLREGRTCPVLAFQVKIMKDGNVIDRSLSITLASVTRNYAYDSAALLSDRSYLTLFQLVQSWFCHNPVSSLDSINNSHDVVAYLMVMMNSYCATELKRLNSGIFRLANPITDSVPPHELLHLKHILCNRASKYVPANGVNDSVYCHITSPMRRLPDLVNMMILSLHLNHEHGYAKFSGFVKKALELVEQIDLLCKSAKRIGDEAHLLHEIAIGHIDVNRSYSAVVIEAASSAEESNQVFIVEIGRWFKVKSNCLMSQYQVINCRIVVFDKADTTVRKVRLQIEN
jgi:exoribonuclease R